MAGWGLITIFRKWFYKLVLGKKQEVRIQRSLEPGEPDDVALLPPAEPAGGQGVAHVARRAGTDGAVIPGLTLSVLTAGILTRRPAVKIKTGAVQRTLAVVDTLSSGASDEGVPPVSRRTGAHGPVRARSVKPGLALGPGAAGVGGAQVLPLELAAADEGVPGVSLGAAADRLVVGGLAGGALSAHIGVWLVARVAALESDARLVAGAVRVSGALCVAPGVGVAQEVRRARALGPVVHSLAVGILSAGASAAGIFTPVILSVTLLGAAAVRISLALVTAALQWVANISLLTPTVGSVVRPDLAVRVDATGGADLFTGEPPAVSEGVSGGASGAAADGNVVLDSAFGALATGESAGIHALVVLAGALGAAVRVLVALTSNAARVRVTVVPGQTFAHWSPAHVLALCAAAAHSLNTRVRSATRPAVRASNVSTEAFAQSSCPALATLGIGPTRVPLAWVQSAAHVRVADVFGRTLADSGPPVVLAERALAARVARARVKVAVGVRVSSVVRATLTNSVAS